MDRRGGCRCRVSSFGLGFVGWWIHSESRKLAQGGDGAYEGRRDSQEVFS